MTGLRARLRRWPLLTVLLFGTALALPDASPSPIAASLVKVETASALDSDPGVTWILALGSDARPGEPVLGSRADSIHLVGINADTGAATIIGIPRDSYVDIPGYGRDKINAAMAYGGPQLEARAVADMVGITPDYVFTTSFWGFSRMVWSIGGVDVHSDHAFSYPLATIRRGVNHVDGVEALVFVRERKTLPNGDFDRSRNQGQFLIDGLRRIATVATQPGGLEKALWTFTKHTDTDIGPVELYRLARGVLELDPRLVDNCVISGRTALAGGASVVLPDLAQAHSYASQARRDATLESGCG